MSRPLLQHPQETWSRAECAKRAKQRRHPGGHPGLVTSDSCPYGPVYGSQRTYNGGCIRDDELYAGEAWPLPIIDDAFEFVSLSGWGLQLRARKNGGDA